MIEVPSGLLLICPKILDFYTLYNLYRSDKLIQDIIKRYI